MEKQWKQMLTLFFWAPKSLQIVTEAMKLKDACSLEGKLTNLDSISTEKAMAPHSSTLAWKIPWTEEPGRLQSMGSLRVRHNWATSLSLFIFMHWRRKWKPTPVFLPGESQGWESLVGCCLWGHTKSDMTEVTYQQQVPAWSLIFLWFIYINFSWILLTNKLLF